MLEKCALQIKEKVRSLDNSHAMTSSHAVYESKRNEWNTDIEMRKEIVSQSHKKSL